MHNTTRFAYGPDDICPAALILPLLDERSWGITFRTVIYLVGLLYFFLGVAIVTDIFMSSIEVITSKTRKVYMSQTSKKSKQNGSYNTVDGVVAGLREDEPEVVEVRIWNDTVANLTLMALGTSAPEILLSIIEVIGHHFEAGQLGPGTIVGSAAFNLLVITSICMVALSENETRRIYRFKVFLVTGLFSFFAYIWLFVILRIISVNVVELWEAILTFIFFPLLICFAYAADRGWCGMRVLQSNKNKQQLELGPLRGDETDKMKAERNFFKEGKLDRASLINFVKEVKKYPGLTDEDAAVLAAAKMINTQPHSVMWYRIGAVRSMTGGRRIQPELNAKLKQVYEAINSETELVPATVKPAGAVDTNNSAVIEFHAATVAVREKVGKFAVTIWRHGNTSGQSRVRVQTIDGTARKGEDYVPINEIITFEPNQREKSIIVEIVNDNKWEPNEEFFLRLGLLHDRNENVQLGRISIMEITILDDDDPGIFTFEKRGMLVKESAGVASLTVVRSRGSDGDVTLKWRTIDKSAISGRDYRGGTGELSFKQGEVRQILQIPIVNDMDPEKDEHFEVELFAPTNGARIGNINRCAVTITNDDDFNNLTDRLMALTNVNLDALRIHKESWWQQIKEAMLVNGGDISNATGWDYLLHFLSFLWKVLFALIPPPAMASGWLTFFISLACIGVMTTIIGDLATIFGCLVGLEDTMTAITLVAIGTSLPDTFASRSTLFKSENADDAVGNINGSNCVNVFLGIGLPWTLAAIYHFSQGTQFVVPSAGLGFSVLLYSICSVVAFILLVTRRNLQFFGKAEIGGPSSGKYLTVFILIAMWVAYLVLSYLQIHGTINVNF